jgi:hypothetical protein
MSDAAAWMLKFVFAYLANTAVLCYSYEKNTILVDNMPLTHAHTIEVPVPITQSERSRINVKGGIFPLSTTFLLDFVPNVLLLSLVERLYFEKHIDVQFKNQ